MRVFKMKPSNGNGRRRFFGPGTVLALIVAVVVIASGRLPGKEPSPLRSGTIAYEADAQGRMRRVDAPSEPAAVSVPPLWKPEPALVLDHASELQLSASQRRRLEALEGAWRGEKARWEAELHRSLEGTGAVLKQSSQGRRLPLGQIQQEMGEYSAISREYDARRAAAWAEAASLLTEAQRQQLMRSAKPGQGSR